MYKMEKVIKYGTLITVLIQIVIGTFGYIAFIGTKDLDFLMEVDQNILNGPYDMPIIDVC